MTAFRIFMCLLAAIAICSATYVARTGYGGASSDLTASIRAASAGNALNRSVK